MNISETFLMSTKLFLKPKSLDIFSKTGFMLSISVDANNSAITGIPAGNVSQSGSL